MWDKILCFFLGHEWRGPKGRELKGLMLPYDLKLVVCIRCEKDFDEYASLKEAIQPQRDLEEELRRAWKEERDLRGLCEVPRFRRHGVDQSDSGGGE